MEEVKAAHTLGTRWSGGMGYLGRGKWIRDERLGVEVVKEETNSTHPRTEPTNWASRKETWKRRERKLCG
jgi:hypothetical protein